MTRPPSRALLLACSGVQLLHLPHTCVRKGACQARWPRCAERLRQCCCFWGGSPQNAWGLWCDSGGKPLWSACSLQLCCCYSGSCASERTRHALVLLPLEQHSTSRKWLGWCCFGSIPLVACGSVAAPTAALLDCAQLCCCLRLCAGR